MELQRNDSKIEYGNLLFCFALSLPSVVYLFTKTVRLVVPRTGSLDTLLMYVLFMYVLARALPELKTAITRRDLALAFALLLVLTLSAMSPSADMALLRSTLKDIAIRCLPVYLGAKLVRDTPRLRLYLRVFALLLLLRVVMNVFVFSPNASNAEGYSQYDGYLLLTAMALLFLPLFREHRTYDIVLAAVILLATLLTGARGPFLASVLLVLTGMLMGGGEKRRSPLHFVLPLGAAIVIYAYMRQILTFIARTFGNDASMRTVQRLLDNAFFEDSTRVRVFSAALDYIRDHLFWGCGVLNDRPILWEAVRGVQAGYAHNLFLELAMQFGLLLGIVVSLLLLASIVRAWFRCGSQQVRLLLTALVFAGFVPLMVSGSYLTFTMFYALIGFCSRRAGTFEEGLALEQSETMGAQALS